jgi:hypothetical protein
VPTHNPSSGLNIVKSAKPTGTARGTWRRARQPRGALRPGPCSYRLPPRRRRWTRGRRTPWRRRTWTPATPPPRARRSPPWCSSTKLHLKSKGLKPGYHITGSRVQTRRFQAVGQLYYNLFIQHSNLYSPPPWWRRRLRAPPPAPPCP